MFDPESIGASPPIELSPWPFITERELEVQDGVPALLELRHSETGRMHVSLWCDSDWLHQRWLIFQVRPEYLARYLRGEVTLQSLIFHAPESTVLLADIVSDDMRKELGFPPDRSPAVVWNLPLHMLPAAYTPNAEYYHDSTG